MGKIVVEAFIDGMCFNSLKLTYLFIYFLIKTIRHFEYVILQQVLKLSFCVYYANRKLIQYYSSKNTRNSEPLEFLLVIYLKY